MRNSSRGPMEYPSDGGTYGYQITTYVLGVPFLITALAANICLIVVIGKFKKLRTKTNNVVVSWAGLDLVSAVILLADITTVNRQWVLEGERYSEGCLLWASVHLIVLLAGLLHMLVLAVDRSCAILFPIQYERFTESRMRAYLAAIWVYALFCGLMPFAWRDLSLGGRPCGLFSLPWLYHILVVTCHSPPLILASALVYARIFYYIKLHERQVHVTHTLTQQQTVRDTRIAVAYVWVTFWFVCAWVPFLAAHTAWVLTAGDPSAHRAVLYGRLLGNAALFIKVPVHYVNYEDVKWGFKQLFRIPKTR